MSGIIAYNHKVKHKKGAYINPLQWIFRCPSLEVHDEVIWDRGSTHNHTKPYYYQNDERIFFLKKVGDKPRFENSKDNEFSSTIWRINRAPKNGHNAPFPEQIVRNALKDFGFPGCTVMDPFMGSGTTGAVAVQMGMDFVGSEILPNYFSMAANRIQEAMGAFSIAAE